jgi:methionyl aminopeptidase
MRKSKEEIAKMRKAGKVVAEMHEATRAAAAPGVTTAQLDKVAHEVISIDCGAIVEGYHGDAAFTMAVGDVSPEAARLIEVTERSLMAGIEQLKEGGRLHEVGRAVQKVAEAAGFTVVREYVGHGIGTAMHEEPGVPNYWPGTPGLLLKSGMVFAVEPMVNLGGPETQILDDGWSVVTRDGKLSAHFEHTIAVTDNGPEILTLV